MGRTRLACVCVLTAMTATLGVRAAGPPSAPASRADAATVDARVDRLFAAWQRPDSPGCSVGVSRAGVTVLERGYGRAARRGKWKAVWLDPAQPIELYDLDADIGETRNLAASQPAVVKQFEAFFATARTPSERWPGR